jgi:hypothetical protein
MAKHAPFSRPVFDRHITIQSHHAQRLLDRGFLLVVRALYSIDVVLRIIGEDDEMDEVEDVVSKLIDALSAELDQEHERLKALLSSNGLTESPRYTNPKELTVHISSPQLAQYTNLVVSLDSLMVAMDTLWLAGVLNNKQRSDGAYQWRSRLFKVGREIIDLERRARASATRQGKDEEVSQAEQVIDAQLAQAADTPGGEEAPSEVTALRSGADAA